MAQVIIAVLVLLGTGLQAWVSLRELRAAKPDAIVHWNTEAALIAEVGPLRRPRARWQLRRSRTLEEHHELRYLYAALGGWVLLFAAAAVGLLSAVVPGA